MEQWLKLEGYEGYGGADDWEVSDELNVRHRGIPVKPKIDSQGYPYVHLCKGGELVRVHRAMLLAFEGPCPEGFVAVKHNGLWRWGPRDMVKLVRHKPKKERPPRKPRKRKGVDPKAHFNEWLAEYIRLENS
jgi:hypothetical protein